MNRWHKLLAAGLMIAFLWVMPTAAGDEPVVLITFSGSVSDEGLMALSTYGARDVTVFDHVPVVAARVKGGATRLATLAGRDDVLLVEPDAPVFMLQQVIPWGVRQIGAPRAWRITLGEGIRVAVLDTGINLNHEDLFVVDGVNTIVPGGSYDDDNGHGTGVAGVISALNNQIGIVGVSPAVDLLSVKVMDANGMGTISSIIAGINWSMANDAQVINMSFGSSAYSQALDIACQNAYQSGIVLVAAASGYMGISYPARFSSVIAACVTDSQDTIPFNSAYGPEMELVAPGVMILTTVGNGYGVVTGASFAAPHVAGTAALVRAANQALSPNTVREILAATALDLGYHPWWQGSGRVQADEAVRAALHICEESGR